MDTDAEMTAWEKSGHICGLLAPIFRKLQASGRLAVLLYSHCLCPGHCGSVASDFSCRTRVQRHEAGRYCITTGNGTLFPLDRDFQSRGRPWVIDRYGLECDRGPDD